MWLELFDERQRKEIRFNQIYLNDFNHGTGDHNLRIIVAKMANLLDELCETWEIYAKAGTLVVQAKIDNDEK